LRVSSVLHAAPKASRPSSCDKRCGGRVCIELPRERGNLESGYEFDATQFPRESLDSGVPMPMFTLKVTLEGIRPPIWRRFVVPAGFSLSQLHRVLQIVMGWTDSHLHQFERGHTIYGLPDPDFGGQHEDERRTRLDAVLERKADWMTYEYDFGDSWTHRVVLEKVEPDVARSAVIVAGKGACPPEDCGGVWGYERVVSAVQDPNHPEHREVREWLGAEFDPAALDLTAINSALRRVPLRELQPRAARRRSSIERVLAGPEEPSPTFRAKLKRKLDDPAAILTDRDVRYLASQVELALAAVPPPTRSAAPSAEDIVRWSAVAARCRQVREERSWTTRDVASALKVARYKIDAVEKGPVRDYELEIAVRYFRLLGLEPWIARWARSSPELARRQGLGR
jgi:DNA-binding XRE family transcriptional regulator